MLPVVVVFVFLTCTVTKCPVYHGSSNVSDCRAPCVGIRTTPLPRGKASQIRMQQADDTYRARMLDSQCWHYFTKLYYQFFEIIPINLSKSLGKKSPPCFTLLEE